ncbi:ATP-dependent nuclease [Endozoicomonas acroporae]|uniref:ATP-dependent nuclease n=1 Tax=Endozoicomonas acroporae TaxID=1701104 RepID=UPI003D7ADDF9
MSVIRHIEIANFRSIKQLSWHPRPGLNCLIGPGDSGKSTLLDAIDLALGIRRSYPFTDADFYRLDTISPIEISVTIGSLDDELKNIEAYGIFLRGYNPLTKEVSDEPHSGFETVITLKLVVDEDLEPNWLLFSERASADGVERRLPWKHKELLSPIKLGTSAQQHLSWGNRSVLNKLSEETLNVSSVLAQLSRNTRQTFADQQVDGVSEVLQQVRGIANNLGVPVGELQAQLDVNGISLSNGAISLHDADNTPLRQLGTGSTRLLISGLQKAVSKSRIVLVDEAEYGLEPYRITRLLNELGSKDREPSQQVFITTHSPYVLRELQACQLHVLRKLPISEQVLDKETLSHKVYSLEGSDEQQATLRSCAESFFSKAVVVCEGKTEIGLTRGIDLYNQENGSLSIHTNGVHCADGAGDSMFTRAKVFASLGYKTALFKDSDKATQHVPMTDDAESFGISVFEWGSGRATEDALFTACPASLIQQLLAIAIDRKGEEAVDAHIQAHSNNELTLDVCRNNFQDSYRPILAKAANKKGWYKDISPAERVGQEIVGPNYSQHSEALTHTVTALFQWALKRGINQ